MNRCGLPLGHRRRVQHAAGDGCDCLVGQDSGRVDPHRRIGGAVVAEPPEFVEAPCRRGEGWGWRGDHGRCDLDRHGHRHPSEHRYPSSRAHSPHPWELKTNQKEGPPAATGAETPPRDDRQSPSIPPLPSLPALRGTAIPVPLVHPAHRPTGAANVRNLGWVTRGGGPPPATQPAGPPFSPVREARPQMSRRICAVNRGLGRRVCVFSPRWAGRVSSPVGMRHGSAYQPCRGLAEASSATRGDSRGWIWWR